MEAPNEEYKYKSIGHESMDAGGGGQSMKFLTFVPVVAC